MKTLIHLLCFIVIAMTTGNVQAQDLRKMMDTTRYGRNKAVGKYADIRGVRMYYEVYGKGEPLLIIHGNGGSINNFLLQIPYFAKKYKVILADNRAQGKTIDHKDSLSYEMISDDLNGLLEHLRIKNAYVIGWSDGGIEGLLLAMNHPDKVKKLAITGANLRPDTTAVDPFLRKMVLNVYHKGVDSLKNMTKPSISLKDHLKLLHLLSFEPNIRIDDIKKVLCPVLVIGGDHDVINTRHTLEIFENIPKAYLWIVPNSGHATPLSYSEQFNKTVSSFFLKPYRSIEKTDRLN